MLTIIGLGTGALPYASNVLKCGRLPVESSRFAASYSYRLPGDKGYGVHPFSEYSFCTEAEIRATNGYHRDVVTDAAKREDEANAVKREEEAKFSPSKVDYKVYVPSLEGYEYSNMRVSEIHSNIHTFYRIKKNGTVVGQVRELKSNDSYNICDPHEDPSKRYCKLIGVDGVGREIRRQYSKGLHDWHVSSAGINIEGTGIILSIESDEEAVKLLGSMKPYSE